jgi:hypothetical protein
MGLVVVIWCLQDMQEGAYPKKKNKSVAGQFAAVKHRSQTYCCTQKLNREDYGVDTYGVTFFFPQAAEICPCGQACSQGGLKAFRLP